MDQFDLHPLLFGDLGKNFEAWYANRSYSTVFLICDVNTAVHCAPYFFEKTGLPKDLPKVVVPAGERHKNMETCQQIWSAMFQAGLDRKALVINLGGGVIGDMGGFCAATYKRGVDFLQLPTTLLSATDASVGGKLGIDFQQIKNAVGVFQHPAGVILDPSFFQTLSKEELHSGFAEVIKHAVIGAPELWHKIAPLKDLNHIDWDLILRLSVGVKAKVVQQDPLEKGLRAVLNYGHTIGHALESYFLETDEPLTHGAAVAWGMVCETRILEQRHGQRALIVSADELEAYLSRFFEKRTLDPTAFDAVWALMFQDKKNNSGQIKMGLPTMAPFGLEWILPEKSEVDRVLSLPFG